MIRGDIFERTDENAAEKIPWECTMESLSDLIKNAPKSELLVAKEVPGFGLDELDQFDGDRTLKDVLDEIFVDNRPYLVKTDKGLRVITRETLCRFVKSGNFSYDATLKDISEELPKIKEDEKYSPSSACAFLVIDEQERPVSVLRCWSIAFAGASRTRYTICA